MACRVGDGTRETHAAHIGQRSRGNGHGGSSTLLPSSTGAGLQLTGEQWLDLIVTPLQADSVVMSMPGVEVHQTDQPLHIAILGQNVSTNSTIWAAPPTPPSPSLRA